MTLTLGSPPPAFTLLDQAGAKRSLAQYRGKIVVLYFYPKDDTPGCTTEACEFRDSFVDFRALGAEVIGISPDTVESHATFVAKYALPLTLLADPTKEVLKEYGAWGTKAMYGREYEGVLRSTVLIDAAGNIAKLYPNVSPEGHAEEILQDIRAL